MNIRLSLCPVVALGLFAPARPGTPLQAAQPLFATGFNTLLYGNSVLYRIDDYPTAPKAVKIGDTGQLMSDLAIDPTTQRFYAVGFTSLGTLYELDPNTGTNTPIGNIGVLENALAFDRQGQLFSCGPVDGRLYRVDKATGFATPAPNPSGFFTLGDIAFDTNGTLYATTTDNNLITIDIATGIGTAVGSLTNAFDQTISNLFGLEIDTDGLAYAGRNVSDGETFTGRAELYSLNKRNGAVTLIGTICGADWFSLSGLAFLGHTNPPVSPTNSIYLAVELDWNSESNRLYQAQWTTNLSSGLWSNLEGWVLGSGSTNYVLDSARGAVSKFYRVQALQ